MNQPATPSTKADPELPPPAKEKMSLRQKFLAALGVGFVGLAAVGVFLPGIPTVGPLLLASLMFTKSSPWLERRLIRNRFFARYLPYLDGTSEMPARTKLAAICTMWISITISCLLLSFTSSSLPPATSKWLIGLIVLAGLAGTVFIWQFGKKRSPTS